MVTVPSTSVIKLRGADEMYHIEVDPETTSKALTSIDTLDGFEIHYTCPNCLSRNESNFTSMPEEVSVFCSSCRKSHLIYDVSDERLVLMNAKLGELIRGVRDLCVKSQMREVVEGGRLSLLDCIFVTSVTSISKRLRSLLIFTGLSLGLIGFFLSGFGVYIQVIGGLLVVASLFKSEAIYEIQNRVRQKLLQWIRENSGYYISSEIIGQDCSSHIVLWKLFS